MSSFPRLIFQFWHDPATLPSEYKAAIRQNAALNPDCECVLADDILVFSLLRDYFSPSLAALYQHNRIPASRSDIARLALLHRHGGVYLDASLRLNQPAHCILQGPAHTLLVKRDDMPKYTGHPEKAHLWNGLIASAPNSPFLGRCLHEIETTLLSGMYNNDVLKATGPGLINSVAARMSIDGITAQSFNLLKSKGLLEHMRIPGLRNSWRPLQAQGIFHPQDLAKLRREFSFPVQD